MLRKLSTMLLLAITILTLMCQSGLRAGGQTIPDVEYILVTQVFLPLVIGGGQ